jgi:hypothetical protein
MFAQIGDKIIHCGPGVDGPDRIGEVVGVRGPGGRPPYRVRWRDDGQVSLVYPGADMFFLHRADRAGA